MDVTELNESLSTLTNDLLSLVVQCNDRVEIGTRNATAVQVLDDEIIKKSQHVSDIRASVNYTNKIYKNAMHFLDLRRESATVELQEELERASYIVPDADVNGLQFDIKAKTARLVNKDKRDVNIREGSAVRAVISQIARNVMLDYDPGAIKLLLLDESFNTMSNETLTAMKEVIAAYAKKLPVVGIEQQGTIFEGLVTKEYRASKDNGVTTIKQVL